MVNKPWLDGIEGDHVRRLIESDAPAIQTVAGPGAGKTTGRKDAFSGWSRATASRRVGSARHVRSARSQQSRRISLLGNKRDRCFVRRAHQTILLTAWTLNAKPAGSAS